MTTENYSLEAEQLLCDIISGNASPDRVLNFLSLHQTLRKLKLEYFLKDCSLQEGKNVGAVVIDVRSPAEFAKGHLPGAINVPLFLNDDRAVVGKIYKKHGREYAIKKSIPLVVNRFEEMVLTVEKQLSLNSSQNDVLPPVRVYCWRGGMRSTGVAWLLSQKLRSHVVINTLDGGYRAWRRRSLSLWGFPPSGKNTRALADGKTPEDVWPPKPPGPQLIVVGGRTGVGKTRVLHALQGRGEQILDLEGLARHSGSSFGWCGSGGDPQPTREQLASTIAVEWMAMDPSRRCFIEDEDISVGTVAIPASLFAAMSSVPIVMVIRVPKSTRIATLVEDYTSVAAQISAGGAIPPKASETWSSTDWEKRMLKNISNLGKRIGTEKVEILSTALRKRKYDIVADALLDYYDKLYNKHLTRGKRNCTEYLEVGPGEEENPGESKWSSENLADAMINRLDDYERSIQSQ